MNPKGTIPYNALEEDERIRREAAEESCLISDEELETAVPFTPEEFKFWRTLTPEGKRGCIEAKHAAQSQEKDLVIVSRPAT